MHRDHRGGEQPPYLTVVRLLTWAQLQWPIAESRIMAGGREWWWWHEQPLRVQVNMVERAVFDELAFRREIGSIDHIGHGQFLAWLYDKTQPGLTEAEEQQIEEDDLGPVPDWFLTKRTDMGGAQVRSDGRAAAVGESHVRTPDGAAGLA